MQVFDNRWFIGIYKIFIIVILKPVFQRILLDIPSGWVLVVDQLDDSDNLIIFGP